MSSFGDDTDGFDPYIGLESPWMDSPLSEWLQPPTIDEIDKAVATDGVTPIGLGPPIVKDAAASSSV